MIKFILIIDTHFDLLIISVWLLRPLPESEAYDL